MFQSLFQWHFTVLGDGKLLYLVIMPCMALKAPPYPRSHPRTPPGGGIEHPEQKWLLYSTSTSSSSESSDTASVAAIELETRDEVNPVAKEESRGDEEVFEAFETIRAESASAEVMDPPPGLSSAAPPPGSANSCSTELMDPSPGTLSSAPPSESGWWTISI